MSSRVYANPVINRTGSVPGITQGLLEDRPAAGYANGDWYLATDEQVLYRWDLASTTWVAELSFGGGGGSTITGDLTTDFYPVATGAHTLGDGQIIKIN